MRPYLYPMFQFDTRLSRISTNITQIFIMLFYNALQVV